MDLIKRFKILLSAPGDVSAEMEKVKGGIELFNRTMGEAQEMFVAPIHWSTHSHPEAGDRPQEILNKQFVRECDAVIALFGTRFGTPTGKFDSGTEEEIEEMLAAGKAVFLYFSDLPKDPNTIDFAQFDKVKAFKEKHKGHALYATFKSLDEIEKKVHADLSLYFLRRGSLDKEQEQRANEVSQSNFELSSDPTDSDDPAALVLFKFDREQFDSVMRSMAATIEKKVRDVMKMSPPPPPPPKAVSTGTGRLAAKLAATSQGPDIITMFNNLNSIVGSRVEVENATQRYITDFARRWLNTELPEGFFYLKDLRENRMAVRTLAFGGGPEYQGDEESQRKYSLICDIEREIERLLGLQNWLGQLNPVSLLLPILKNTGGHFDEDITVDLFFPLGSVQLASDLAQPDFECSEFVTEKILPFIFQTPKKYDVEEYTDYPKHMPYINTTLPFKTHDMIAKERADEYAAWIENHFYYEVHESGGQQVVSCKFSYLRQHTAMFFPAPLLLKQRDITINYRIRSKHSAKIFSGTVKLA